MTVSQINPCLGVFCYFQINLILTAEASSLVTFVLNTLFVSEIKATSSNSGSLNVLKFYIRQIIICFGLTHSP